MSNVIIDTAVVVFILQYWRKEIKMQKIKQTNRSKVTKEKLEDIFAERLARIMLIQLGYLEMPEEKKRNDFQRAT